MAAEIYASQIWEVWFTLTDLIFMLMWFCQVRNLCYMVSRREKLKLSQSKAQEQIFNLHVKLINQELSAGNKCSPNICVYVHLNLSLLRLSNFSCFHRQGFQYQVL